ncbi:hypothetical protein C7M84_011848 [Penaeus vannamei]|uniref:Uncharacterized protein n=1 Tax=Penaeus vannamei TaxID=6689 RepID=A0A423T0B5_PENVA|nr:hypothetical protein C7M84_011848 [Penaeus vannamei]
MLSSGCSCVRTCVQGPPNGLYKKLNARRQTQFPHCILRNNSNMKFLIVLALAALSAARPQLVFLVPNTGAGGAPAFASFIFPEDEPAVVAAKKAHFAAVMSALGQGNAAAPAEGEAADAEAAAAEAEAAEAAEVEAAEAAEAEAGAAEAEAAEAAEVEAAEAEAAEAEAGAAEAEAAEAEAAEAEAAEAEAGAEAEAAEAEAGAEAEAVRLLFFSPISTLSLTPFTSSFLPYSSISSSCLFPLTLTLPSHHPLPPLPFPYSFHPFPPPYSSISHPPYSPCPSPPSPPTLPSPHPPYSPLLPLLPPLLFHPLILLILPDPPPPLPSSSCVRPTQELARCRRVSRP